MMTFVESVNISVVRKVIDRPTFPFLTVILLAWLKRTKHNDEQKPFWCFPDAKYVKSGGESRAEPELLEE